MKRNEETLGIDGHVYILTLVMASQVYARVKNVSKCMPKICPALYVNYTLIKLF